LLERIATIEKVKKELHFFTQKCTGDTPIQQIFTEKNRKKKFATTNKKIKIYQPNIKKIIQQKELTKPSADYLLFLE